MNGELVEGVMDKANLGEGAGLMLRNLNKRYGSSKAMEIIGQMSRMGIYYLLIRGFTVTLSETDIDSETEAPTYQQYCRDRQAGADAHKEV
jgi:hypothetical protein